MHKKLPKFFIFLDKYNNKFFNRKDINIGIIYRNYNDRKRESQLIKIAKECKKNRYQLFVSNDIKLALKYKANGIYIPAFNKTKKFSNIEKRKLTILGSAHNQKEIHTKMLQKCDAIFLSPLFNVKKSKKYLDLHKFNYLTHLNKIKIYALGGISLDNINKLKLLNIYGLGGISLFKKKTGLKETGFNFKE
ncbi:MAG: thiamine-phosphate pyrophosphorylase [Pelagibacterales bacterium]|nr:thiamine-phosphate pyrophosphorylase [Pelagibacterales bacterium]